MTGQTPGDAAAARHEAAALLHDVFHDPRFSVPGYLDWLYGANPVGPAVAVTEHDADGAVGHYALVPQLWRAPDGRTARLGITLDAVVRGDAQRRGVFRRVATEVYRQAAAGGVAGTITVANASSEPPFTRYLGFRRLGSLPVVALVPAGPRGSSGSSGSGGSSGAVRSLRVDDDLLAGPHLDELAADVAALPPVRGWEQAWSAATLRWRLANPAGSYVLHVADDVALVSAEHRLGPVRVAVLAKLLARREGIVTPLGALVRAACRAHRAPVAVHAGWNARVAVRGVPLPRRLLPSPLHLLVRDFAPEASAGHAPPPPPAGADVLPGPVFDAAAVAVATYEFLDADHY